MTILLYKIIYFSDISKEMACSVIQTFKVMQPLEKSRVKSECAVHVNYVILSSGLQKIPRFTVEEKEKDSPKLVPSIFCTQDPYQFTTQFLKVRMLVVVQQC